MKDTDDGSYLMDNGTWHLAEGYKADTYDGLEELADHIALNYEAEKEAVIEALRRQRRRCN